SDRRSGEGSDDAGDGGLDEPDAALDRDDGIDAGDATEGGVDAGTVVFHPEDLPRASPYLMLWLDPGQGLSTDPRFLWRDRSAAHSDATADAASSPVVRQEEDGVPPMLELSGNQYLSLPAAQIDFGIGVTIFVVAEPAPFGPMSFLDF